MFKKRALAFLLSIVIAVSALPLEIFAATGGSTGADNVPGNGLQKNVSYGRVGPYGYRITIGGYSGMDMSAYENADTLLEDKVVSKLKQNWPSSHTKSYYFMQSTTTQTDCDKAYIRHGDENKESAAEGYYTLVTSHDRATTTYDNVIAALTATVGATTPDYSKLTYQSIVDALISKYGINYRDYLLLDVGSWLLANSNGVTYIPNTNKLNTIFGSGNYNTNTIIRSFVGLVIASIIINDANSTQLVKNALNYVSKGTVLDTLPIVIIEAVQGFGNASQTELKLYTFPQFTFAARDRLDELITVYSTSNTTWPSTISTINLLNSAAADDVAVSATPLGDGSFDAYTNYAIKGEKGRWWAAGTTYNVVTQFSRIWCEPVDNVTYQYKGVSVYWPRYWPSKPRPAAGYSVGFNVRWDTGDKTLTGKVVGQSVGNTATYQIFLSQLSPNVGERSILEFAEDDLTYSTFDISIRYRMIESGLVGDAEYTGSWRAVRDGVSCSATLVDWDYKYSRYNIPYDTITNINKTDLVKLLTGDDTIQTAYYIQNKGIKDDIIPSPVSYNHQYPEVFIEVKLKPGKTGTIPSWANEWTPASYTKSLKVKAGQPPSEGIFTVYNDETFTYNPGETLKKSNATHTTSFTMPSKSNADLLKKLKAVSGSTNVTLSINTKATGINAITDKGFAVKTFTGSGLNAYAQKIADAAATIGDSTITIKASELIKFIQEDEIATITGYLTGTIDAYADTMTLQLQIYWSVKVTIGSTVITCGGNPPSVTKTYTIPPITPLPVAGKFAVEVTPQEEPVPTTNISGKTSDIKVTLNMPKASKDALDWYKNHPNLTSAKMVVTLKYKDTNNTTLRVASTLSSPSTGGKADTYNSSQGTYTGNHTTKSAAQSLLTYVSTDNALLTFKDTLDNPTTIGSTSEFKRTYYVSINITVVISGNTYTINWAGDPDTDYASWTVLPALYTYNSIVADVYAELKQGYLSSPNYTSSTEEFEAMAGTPSTRNMYFAVGGNDFVVQASYQIKTQSVSRSYTFAAIATDSKENNWFSKNHKCKASADGTYTEKCGGHKIYKTTDGSWSAVSCSHSCPGHGNNATTGSPNPCPKSGACIPGSAASSWSWSSPTDPKDCTTTGWTSTPVNASPAPPSSCGPCGASVTATKAPSPTVTCGGDKDVSGTYITATANGLSTVSTSYSHKHCECTQHHTSACPKSAYMDCNPKQNEYKHGWNSVVSNLPYMSITDLKVWQISAARVNGTGELFEDDALIATAGSNSPHLFYSCISSTTTSQQAGAGRVIYTYEPLRKGTVALDEVFKDAGKTYYTSSEATGWIEETYNNVNTQSLIPTFQNKPIQLTVVSDFIILNNHNGKQESIYYHEYEWEIPNIFYTHVGDNTSYLTANNVTTVATVAFDAATATVNATKCTSLPQSSAGMYTNASGADNQKKLFWDNTYAEYIRRTTTSGSTTTSTTTHYSGYDGTKYNSSTKYSGRTAGASNTLVGTKWNTYYTSIFQNASNSNKSTNPASNTPPASGLNISVSATPVDTSPNGVYSFGQTDVFFKQILNFHNPTDTTISVPSRFTNKTVSFASGTGFTKQAKYAAGWSTINSVVIFDPIAVVGSISSVGFSEYRAAGQNSSYVDINIEGRGQLQYSLSSCSENPRWDSNSSLMYLGNISTTLGKGYSGIYDTSEWVRDKYVIFGDYVIIDTNGDGLLSDEIIHKPGELIKLAVRTNGGTLINAYDFYLPACAFESKKVEVQFIVDAINKPYNKGLYNTQYQCNDNWPALCPPNRHLERDSDVTDRKYFEAVGRIGNLSMTDTGDFRYSNYFKKTLSAGGWVIPNIIREVDLSAQSTLIVDKLDIFKRNVVSLGLAEKYNTYGTQGYKQTTPFSFFPLTPSKNNIPGYKDIAVRVGYPAMLDIETLGNYYAEVSETTVGNYLDVKQQYYAFNKDTKAITAVDVYMKVGSEYKLINSFKKDKPVYDYKTYMNWETEQVRRMLTEEEKTTTEVITAYYGYVGIQNSTSIAQGNRNVLHVNSLSRNFIGSVYSKVPPTDIFNSTVAGLGEYMSKGYRINDAAFGLSSQKWYWTLGLPSSAVFVPAGTAYSEAAVKSVNTTYNQLLVSAYIKAIGSVWTLQYPGSASFQINESGSTVTLPPTFPLKDPNNSSAGNETDYPTPLLIMTLEETSKDDLSTVGTH